MAKTILELDTLVDRPHIAIDGELYEILSPDELNIVDLQRFTSHGKRLDALMAKNSISQKQEKELSMLLSGLTDRIMEGVPEHVRNKLSDAQRIQVAEVFTMLPLTRSLEKAAAGAKSDGTKPSPGSSVSTGARRAAGSTTSLSS